VKSRLFIVILTLLFANFVSANQDIRIISSDQSGFTFEYSPNYFEIRKDLVDGIEYLSIPFDGAMGYSDDLVGKIFLMHRNIQIGVPSEFGNTLQVISTQHKIVKGKIAPIRGDKNLNSNEIVAAQKSFQNQELVSFGEFGYSRDFPLQSILISPIQYNVETDEIKLFSKIVVRVSFGKVVNNSKTVKNEILKNVVPNFEIAKNWGKNDAVLQKSNPSSVKMDGTWYRFKATSEGIYKISRTELASLGIDASTVDPRTIKIFNNGGFSLNESVQTSTPYGMTENAILVEGEEDGVFNQNDYILFYGRANDFWDYNVSSTKIERNHHPFSKNNYYWISFGGENGKRMISEPSVNTSSAIEQTTSVAFLSLDNDKINLGRSGRDYWGDEFNTTTKSHTYINTLESRSETGTVSYYYRFANASKNSQLLTVSENGTTLATQTLGGFGANDYYWGVASLKNAFFTGTLPEDRSALKFEVSITSSEVKAYIDYLEIEYLRDLKVLMDEVILFNNQNRSEVKYKLNNFSNSDVLVFDITEFANVKSISSPNISGGDVNFTVNEGDGYKSKYIVLTSSKFKSISGIEKVEIPTSIVSGEGAEYIIITDKKFSSEAERLASYRKNDAPNKLSTKVVYVDEILNEFSCGMMDPTAIRNFLKYGYENWQTKPFYVLLFGDGDYDYFNAEGYSKNFVPTYQIKESLNELYSYPMDDFYGRIVGNDSVADLAMGRLNIQTTTDAQNVVDKIIAYELPDNGMWKNTITLVADDRETTDGLEANLHTPQSERLVAEKVPGFMETTKIYLAAYSTIITGFGRRKPEVNEAIINAVNQGTLILNYIGHGNPDVWAHESVFERTSSIPSLKNDKLFFLTAATCDFGRFDDPTVQSSTEELLLAESRGMIGGFSAARVVYSHANEAINLELYSHLLSNSLEYMSEATVGEAFYLTKMKMYAPNDEKFHLFCDPAIRLNVPKNPASIVKVNNSELTSNIQLKALSQVSIEGTVNNYDGTTNSSINGEAIITVYDSEIVKKLPELGTAIGAQMVVPGGVIFRGRTSVVNGKFSTKFTVPQDILYENRNGKITAYITENNNDGIGFTENVIIGGTDSTANNDGNGPEIEITFDNAESASASLVNQDFTIVLNLQDETGLNTTGTGIGHKLKGIIDDNSSNEIDFTNYFVGDLDAEGKSGQVNYKITNYDIGEHKIDVTAWDVYNNPSQQISYFTVVNSEDVVLTDVVNYPNPFSNNTTFLFQHNISSAIDVKIKIYTIAGRLIKNIENFNVLDKYVKIDWNGKDEDGSQIANGTYLYKVIIKSIDGKNSQNVIGKLSIIH